MGAATVAPVLLAATLLPVHAGPEAPKVLAVVAAHTSALPPLMLNRARQSALQIARRLGDLGAASFALGRGGGCKPTRPLDAVIRDAAALQHVARCIEEWARSLELVVLYYVGPLPTEAKLTLFPGHSGTAAASAEAMPIDEVLNAVAERGRFTSLVFIDTLMRAGAGIPAAALPLKRRISTGGNRRILVSGVSAMAPEAQPDTTAGTTFAHRLAIVLDGEIEARRAGRTLSDVRNLVSRMGVVEIPAEQGNRSREVLLEGLERKRITIEGIAPAAWTPSPEPVDCSQGPVEAIADGGRCAFLIRFQQSCAHHMLAPVIATALRLRCRDDLLEQRRMQVAHAFRTAERAQSCAAIHAFVDRHGADPDLGHLPEMQKAAGLKVRLCSQEAHKRETASLELKLAEVLREPNCGTLRKLRREDGVRLTVAQSERLDTALTARCALEMKAQTDLRACLDRAEAAGSFCGGAACFQSFQAALRKDIYMEPHRTEKDRWERICRESRRMTTCFAADACGGDRCSLQVRLAVANGPLIGFIQGFELEARSRCASGGMRKSTRPTTRLRLADPADRAAQPTRGPRPSQMPRLQWSQQGAG